jgi:hypothetical protein
MVRIRSGKETRESSDDDSQSTFPHEMNNKQEKIPRSTDGDDGNAMDVDESGNQDDSQDQPEICSKLPKKSEVPETRTASRSTETAAKDEGWSKSLSFNYLIFFICIILAAFAAVHFNGNDLSCFSDPRHCDIPLFGERLWKHRSKASWEEFKNRFMTNFTSKYDKALPTASFNVIKGGVRTFFKALEEHQEAEESTGPTVFFISGQKSNKNVSCFVDDLELLLANSLDEPRAMKFSSSDLTSPSSMSSAFESALGDQSNRHVVTIDDINSLNKETFLHLHPFTDHSSARYKVAIIILVAYSDKVNKLAVNSQGKDMDAVASSLIREHFISQMSDEMIDPMIARILPYPLVVLDYPGTSSVCDN